MSDPNERTDGETGAETSHDILSGLNAAEIVDDPDELERHDPQPPAATPDSPNPI